MTSGSVLSRRPAFTPLPPGFDLAEWIRRVRACIRHGKTATCPSCNRSSQD